MLYIVLLYTVYSTRGHKLGEGNYSFCKFREAERLFSVSKRVAQ